MVGCRDEVNRGEEEGESEGFQGRGVRARPLNVSGFELGVEERPPTEVEVPTAR